MMGPESYNQKAKNSFNYDLNFIQNLRKVIISY